jgi:alpha-D-xyloside xylohydrolase
MNEVSNFCSGDVCSPPGGASPTDTEKAVAPNNNFQCKLDCTWGVPAGAKKSNLPPPGIFDPPFKLNNAGAQRNLSEKTLPITATHPASGALEYDAHNLYGHYMSLVTVDALADLNRNVRPFAFGRSTFLGTGRVAGHWTGDTSSGWRDLRRLIPAVLAAGLSGNPFTGGDVCGFMNLATPDLCAAWVAAACMHPLMRFHHAQGFQEPYRWPTVAEATRKAVGVRYRLLPALYSAGAASSAGGCPIARPAWFAWPAAGASRGASGAWTVGDSLLVVPLLAAAGGEAPAVPAPPGATLYDFWRRTRVAGGSPAAPPPPEVGGPTILAIGGSVTPVGRGGNSTAAARDAPLTLVLAMQAAAPTSVGGGDAQSAPAPALKCGRPCAQGVPACGDVYLDRGDEREWGLGAGRGRVLAVDAADDYGVDLSWPSAQERGGKGGGGCDRGVVWPRLERLVVLGAHPGSGSGGRVRVKASKGADAPREGTAALDRATGALEVTFPDGRGVELVCGAAVEIRWEVDRQAGEGAASAAAGAPVAVSSAPGAGAMGEPGAAAAPPVPV